MDADAAGGWGRNHRLLRIAKRACARLGETSGAAMPQPQTYKNHVHRPIGPTALSLLNFTLFITALVELVRHYDLLHWVLLGLAVSTGSAAAAARE